VARAGARLIVRLAWKDGDRIRTVELTPNGAGRYRVSLDGAEIEVEAERTGPDTLRLRTADGETQVEVTASGNRRFIRLGLLDFVLDREDAGARRRDRSQGSLEAPMPGVVTRLMVASGDEVKKGQPLVAVEAMKMEHLIRAPRDGRVKRVAAVVGEMVGGGVALVELED